MKRFKTYLVEADQTGAVWENLIAAGWNSKVWTGAKDEKDRGAAVDEELAKNTKAQGLWKQPKAHAALIAQATA